MVEPCRGLVGKTESTSHRFMGASRQERTERLRLADFQTQPCVIERWIAEPQQAVDTRNLPFSNCLVRGVTDRLPVIPGGVGGMDHQYVFFRRAIRLLNQSPRLIE